MSKALKSVFIILLMFLVFSDTLSAQEQGSSNMNSEYIIHTLKEFLWLGVLIIGLLIWMVFAFLGTLKSAIQVVKPHNRRINPNEVYLMLIPLFNNVWVFIMVNRMADSFDNELRSRNLTYTPKPTYNIGLAYAVLNLACLILPYILPFYYLGYSLVVNIALIVCFIAYWISVSNIKSELESGVGSNITNNSNVFNNNQQSNSNINGGYQGGYSGGHNNHKSSYSPPLQNNPTNHPNNDSSTEYKSGDLYK